MSNTKYGKYILREPFGKANHEEIKVPVIHIGQGMPVQGWDGVPFSFTAEAITTPFEMVKKPHRHEEVEIIFFMGADPLNFQDFGAEAYIMLGEEAEKHVINTTSFIYIPKGFLHCPLVFTRVDKPIVFGHVLFAPVFKKLD